MSEPPPQEITNHKARILWQVTAALLLIALIWIAAWFFYFRYYEWTDDAYANGNLIYINPAISGSIVTFFADDTDLVEEGQLLALIDSTEYQALYDRELATLAQVVLEVKQLFDEVHVARANVTIQKIALKRARYDYKNRLKIAGTGAVSDEDFIHSKDAFFSARSQLRQAKYQLQVAKDAAGNTKMKEHPLIEQQKGNVRDAYYKLSHCAIYAPSTGYIAQRSVDVGEWVSPATNMMAVIPQEYVWVDANFKETELTHMRIGQPTTVTFDIYGSKVKYRGKVLGIASGTGSVFSIIPPQNATGNWIKIVQRLPVRISLDPEVLKKYPTRLGLSAEVTVDVSNHELPMLAQVPAAKPISSTDVYNIHLEKAELLMDEIISLHMK